MKAKKKKKKVPPVKPMKGLTRFETSSRLAKLLYPAWGKGGESRAHAAKACILLAELLQEPAGTLTTVGDELEGGAGGAMAALQLAHHVSEGVLTWRWTEALAELMKDVADVHQLNPRADDLATDKQFVRWLKTSHDGNGFFALLHTPAEVAYCDLRRAFRAALIRSLPERSRLKFRKALKKRARK